MDVYLDLAHLYKGSINALLIMLIYTSYMSYFTPYLILSCTTHF